MGADKLAAVEASRRRRRSPRPTPRACSTSAACSRARARRSAPCTWPRSSPRGAPMRPPPCWGRADDPHAAADLRGHAAVPGRRAGGARRRAAADQPRATRRRRSATKRARAVAEREDWEDLRLAGRRDQGRRHGPPAGAARAARGARRRPPAASCTGRATPRRPTRSSSASSATPAPTEVVKVKSMATQEIELNEALAAGRDRRLGDRPRRAHRPARPRPAVAHPGARRSTATGPRSATSSWREMAGAGRPAPADLTDDPRGAGRGRPAPPAREVPARPGRHLRRELRHRRDGHRRWSSSPRATAGCA